MSNLILNDNVIGGSSNDSSDILYTPNDNRAETNVQAELDRINTNLSDSYTRAETIYTFGTTVNNPPFTVQEDGIYVPRIQYVSQDTIPGNAIVYINGLGGWTVSVAGAAAPSYTHPLHLKRGDVVGVGIGGTYPISTTNVQWGLVRYFTS